ncbi:MAG: demethoxyubiquinone hydroxylase family protein [Polaromonas sp.]|nr:demethoxyubiquinone hydroxylase family protein [Polaromonas sp.]
MLELTECPTLPASLTVLYDGACPLCRREIGVYQGLQPVNASQTLAFADISRADTPLPPGGIRSDYLARFHVQRADGQVLSGAAAFVALWATLPGWRYLALVARLPGATPAMELAYRAFLRIRPQMQGIAKAFEAPRVAKALAGDLRSDQAGETGAVWIYRGLLAVSTDAGVREFAQRHLKTEQDHLGKINAVLQWPQRSRLLPAWRVAGFATGALPALFGPRAVYATIAAVETFVDQHYQHQIDKLQHQPEHAELLALLRQCQQDECEHRDEALALQAQPPSWLLRVWCKLVGSGSSAAVELARRI